MNWTLKESVKFTYSGLILLEPKTHTPKVLCSKFSGVVINVLYLWNIAPKSRYGSYCCPFCYYLLFTMYHTRLSCDKICMNEPRYFKCFVKSTYQPSISIICFARTIILITCLSVQESRHYFSLFWVLCKYAGGVCVFTLNCFWRRKEIRLREENTFIFLGCIPSAKIHL